MLRQLIGSSLRNTPPKLLGVSFFFECLSFSYLLGTEVFLYNASHHQISQTQLLNRPKRALCVWIFLGIIHYFIRILTQAHSHSPCSCAFLVATFQMAVWALRRLTLTQLCLHTHTEEEGKKKKKETCVVSLLVNFHFSFNLVGASYKQVKFSVTKVLATAQGQRLEAALETTQKNQNYLTVSWKSALVLSKLFSKFPVFLRTCFK